MNRTARSCPFPAVQTFAANPMLPRKTRAVSEPGQSPRLPRPRREPASGDAERVPGKSSRGREEALHARWLLDDLRGVWGARNDQGQASPT